ncbi:hypothetical protein V1509DRAFT_623427 [Lipomyces kononenkoae]
MAPSTRSRKRRDSYSQNNSDDIAATKSITTAKTIATPELSTARVLRSRSHAQQNQDSILTLASPPARRTRSKNTALTPIAKGARIRDVSGTTLKENISPNNVQESGATISLLSQSVKLPNSESGRRAVRSTTPQKRRNLRGRQRRGASPDLEPEIEAEQISEESNTSESLRSSESTPECDVEQQRGYEVLDTTIAVEAYTAATAELQDGPIDEVIDAHADDAVNNPSSVTGILAPSTSVDIADAGQLSVKKDVDETQQDSAATLLHVPHLIDIDRTNKVTANGDSLVTKESQDHSTTSADSAAITDGNPGQSTTDDAESIILENKIIGENKVAEDSSRIDEEPDVLENKSPPRLQEMSINPPQLLEQPPMTEKYNSPICNRSLPLEMNSVGHADEMLDQPMTHIEQSFQDSNSSNVIMALDPALLSSPPAVSASFENGRHELHVSESVSEESIDSAEPSNTSSMSPTVIVPSQRSYLEFSRRMDKYNRLRSMFSIGHIPRSPSALAFYRRAYSDASSEATSEADDVESVANRQDHHSTPQVARSSPESSRESQLPVLHTPTSDSDESWQFMDSFESFDVHLSQALPGVVNVDGLQVSDHTESSRQDLVSNASNMEPVILPLHQGTPSPTACQSSSTLLNTVSTPAVDETAEDRVSFSIESPLRFSQLATTSSDPGEISDFLPEDIIQWEKEQRQREACWTPSARTSPAKRGSPQPSFSGRSSLSMGSPMRADSPTGQRSSILAPFTSGSCTKQSSPAVPLSPSRPKSPVKLSTPIKIPSPLRLTSYLQRLSTATNSPLKIVSLPDEGSNAGACEVVENAKNADNEEKDGEKGIHESTEGVQTENANPSLPDSVQESQSVQSIQPAPNSQRDTSDSIVEDVDVEPPIIVTEESDSENDIYFDSVANISLESTVSVADGSTATRGTIESVSDQPTESGNVMEVNETNGNEAEDGQHKVPVVEGSEDGIDYGSHSVDIAGEGSNVNRRITINSTEDSNKPAHGLDYRSVTEREVPDDSSASMSTIILESRPEKPEGLANRSVGREESSSELTPEAMSNEQKEDISEETTVGSSNYFASDENTSDIDYATVLPWNISLDRWAELNKRQEKSEVATTNAITEEGGADMEQFAASAEHQKSPSPVRSSPTRRYISTPARSSARSSLKRKYDNVATSTIPTSATSGASDGIISSRGRATRSETAIATKVTTHLSKITNTNSKLNSGFENIIIPHYQYKRGKRPESPPPEKRKRRRSIKKESPLKRERKIKFATQVSTIAGKGTSISMKKDKESIDLKPIIKVSLANCNCAAGNLMHYRRQNIPWMSLGMQCSTHCRHRSETRFV